MKKTLTLKQQKNLTIKNLKKVLRELPKLAKKIPEIKEDFFMNAFGVYEGLEKENLNRCGAVGCLLGNAARIFADQFTDDLFINNKFDYRLFCRKYFPYLYYNLDYLNMNMDYILRRKIMWMYLFSGGWAKTKFCELEDALQRIKNLLDNDLKCNAFDYKTNKIIN